MLVNITNVQVPEILLFCASTKRYKFKISTLNYQVLVPHKIRSKRTVKLKKKQGNYDLNGI